MASPIGGALNFRDSSGKLNEFSWWSKDCKSWSNDKLRREIDHESQEAGWAFYKKDREDALRRVALVERYWEELCSRR